MIIHLFSVPYDSGNDDTRIGTRVGICSREATSCQDIGNERIILHIKLQCVIRSA